MAAANTLFNALGVPWKVKIDDEIAELKVEALGCCLRGDHDGCVIAEVVNNGGSRVK